MSTTKVCTHCHKRKPVPAAYYRNGETRILNPTTRKKTVVDRFRPECKACFDVARKAKKTKARKK